MENSGSGNAYTVIKSHKTEQGVHAVLEICLKEHINTHSCLWTHNFSLEPKDFLYATSNLTNQSAVTVFLD